MISSSRVMDLLRFQKFTVGYAWVSNYGSSDEAEGFANLRGISPLHNITEPADCQVTEQVYTVHLYMDNRFIFQYPALLLVTADHDDRGVPSHSLKHIATLQHTLGAGDKQVGERD